MLLKWLASLSISCAGIGGSIYLKKVQIISEPSLVILILAFILVGLFIYYSDKVKSINLKEGELTLKEIKETELSVKELGKAILEVTEASSHSIMMETFDSETYEKSVNKLKELIA